MTILYRDDEVEITHDTVHVDGSAYRVSEFDAVWIERGYVHFFRTAAVIVLRLLVALGAVGLLVGFAVLLFKGHTPVIGGFSPSVRTAIAWGSIVGGPALMAVLIYSAERVHDLGTREFCLCAHLPTGSVLLVSTTNPTRFGQIHRALVRALEHTRG
jgi:hypothetical protein